MEGISSVCSLVGASSHPRAWLREDGHMEIQLVCMSRRNRSSVHYIISTWQLQAPKGYKS